MDSTFSAHLSAPSTAHRTPYGECMSTGQVKDFLSEGNHPSTLISGGVLDVLNSYGRLHSVPSFGMLHNFVPDGSTMRGLRDDLSAMPVTGLTHSRERCCSMTETSIWEALTGCSVHSNSTLWRCLACDGSTQTTRQLRLHPSRENSSPSWRARATA